MLHKIWDWISQNWVLITPIAYTIVDNVIALLPTKAKNILHGIGVLLSKRKE